MNFGIIGYGYTGQQHARAVAEIDGVELKAIADLDDVKRSMAWVPSHSDYRSILDDKEIEVVSICLPHHLHEELVSAAMLAGKHVVVEKPLALSVSAGRRLCELARATSRVLMVEMTHRFLPPLQEAKRLIAAGSIGQIMAVDEVLIEDIGLFGSLPSWMLDRGCAGGGVGLTSGIHLLDHISWITQQKLTLDSSCFGYTQELGSIEDTASFTLKMDRGAPVHILMCWRRQGSRLDGNLIIVGSHGSLRVWPWDGITLESGIASSKKSYFRPESTIAERALVGMKGAIQEFVNAIRQDRLPDPPADESLKSQEIIELAYQQFGA